MMALALFHSFSSSWKNERIAQAPQDDKNERNNVTENLNNSGLEIIDISVNQMTSFLGNCIQLINSDQSPILIMSSRAFNSISKSQLKRIESQTEIIHSEIKTIENNGGGSARCMIAEVF